MNNITTLAALIARAAAAGASRKTDNVEVGQISGPDVLVNGKKYKIIMGGDFDIADGDRADCVISGVKCILLRASG